MKTIKENISIILLILFEIAVGVLLLVNPEAFTRTVIILFGVILLAIGIINLIHYLRDKKEEIKNILALLIAVVTLTIGIICTFCSGGIIKLVVAMAIIYGVIFVISGIYKLHNYFQLKKAGISVSRVSLISGLLAIIIGLVIVIYPEGLVFSVWQLAGILLIVEATIDLFAIIQVVKDTKGTSEK